MAVPTRLRSVLFAPAVRTDHLDTLAERGADAVVIDCEDATPPGAKVDGRFNARRYAGRLAAAGATVLVRVNAIETPWFEEDVAVGVTHDVAAVVVPKLESLADLGAVTAALDRVGLTHVTVVAGLESARGIAEAGDICRHPRVVAAYFGAEDYIADLGGRRTESNHEVFVARSLVALAGRLGEIVVIDQVVTDFRNLERFERECDEALDLGYSGKLCIHPGQVPVANRLFTPTAADIARAQAVVDAYERASAAGVGVVEVDGVMIDAPLVAQARRVLHRADEGR